MKKEARLLKAKALNSLLLGVEHFNRPWNVGRIDAVLIFLDHSFEMLLKAAILQRNGQIREKGAKNTIGFDDCVRKGVSGGQIKFLTEEQALTLQAVNGLRDAAQHHLLDISEGHLYLHAQTSVTLFRDLLRSVFGEELRVSLPDRVLPVSTVAPIDPLALFAEEIAEVARLLKPRTRRRTEAAARLRALAIVDGAIQGEKLQPSERELARLGKAAVEGKALEDIFPGIASIRFITEGSGATVNLRISKKEGIPIRLVPEGTADASVVAVKRVDELAFYNLGHKALAEKVSLSPNKTTALVWYLNLKDDPDFFKAVTIGKSTFQRYSQNAISKIKEALEDPGVDEIWRLYRANLKSPASAGS